jgi:hypothetical protein
MNKYNKVAHVKNRASILDEQSEVPVQRTDPNVQSLFTDKQSKSSSHEQPEVHPPEEILLANLI